MRKLLPALSILFLVILIVATVITLVTYVDHLTEPKHLKDFVHKGDVIVGRKEASILNPYTITVEDSVTVTTYVVYQIDYELYHIGDTIK